MNKKNSTPVKVKEDEQQLSLALSFFKLPAESEHVNFFDSFEALPLFTSPKHHLIKRGDNNLAQFILKETDFNKLSCFLKIQPATLVDPQNKESQKSFFPYTAEAKIKSAIFKIASETINLELGEEGRVTLLTSINKISNVLQKANGTKKSPYNHTQIKHSLNCLTDTRYELVSEDARQETIKFSIFENFKSTKIKGNTTISITFNEFISKSILATTWRRINFPCLVRSQNPEMLSIYTLLYSRWTFANMNQSFNIKYSTLKKRTSIKQYSRERDTMNALESILELMKDIISRVERVNLVYDVDKNSGRKNLVDFTFHLFATESFINEQISNNAHHKALDKSMNTEPNRLNYLNE